MKALSLRQPWAWLVLHHKPIENRRWNTNFRGAFLIHAAKGMTRDDYAECVSWVGYRFGSELAAAIPPFGDLARGGIVGAARVSGVLRPGTTDHAPLLANTLDVDVRWHMEEQYGFVLAERRATVFVAHPGSLGFFNVPDAIAEQALRGAT